MKTAAGDLPLAEAVEKLMTMPGYVCAQNINLTKVELPDGREAVLQIKLDTDDHELDWYEGPWNPNQPTD